ncbi:MAG: efflux RND transporter periplasmic adaptor subunit [Candidatus Eisenbacteria bacterium]
MPPTPVEIADVRPQTVRDQFRALGGVASQDQIEVVSELNATVIELPFTEGQALGRGALIARLDAREFQAESERAEAHRAQAQSNNDRAKKLVAENAISTQVMDDARTALKVAEANAALAKARFDKTRIRAPFAGLVGRRRVSRGAYLRSGDVITDLARVDEMKVTFAAPERYASQLRLGVPVDVTTPAFPNEHFPGRIGVVDPVIDPQTRTVQLVARIPNPSRRLRPGMSANISVTFAERSSALVVPDEAVFAEGNQSFVFVVTDSNTVDRTPVRLGSRDSMQVEILEGLVAGQRVVRAGHQKLFPGAKVMPVGGAGAPAGPAAGGGK